MISIKPWRISSYTQVEGYSRSKIETLSYSSSSPPTVKNYTGVLTKASMKRLKNAIKLLIAISKDKNAMNFKTNTEFKFRCNFITLTLSSAQLSCSDKEIKRKIFDPWIKKAKRWFNLKSYVWRAERQKNENIHFHLITDTYIDHAQLRDSWNQSQELLGFITAFEKVHGHRNPNSTDVHAIKKIRDLASYICKYISKGGDSKNLIDGKVWGCSENLSAKISCTLMNDGLIRTEFEEWLAKYPDNKFTNDYSTTLSLSEKQWKHKTPSLIKTTWEMYLQQVREYQKKEEALQNN